MSSRILPFALLVLTFPISSLTQAQVQLIGAPLNWNFYPSAISDDGTVIGGIVSDWNRFRLAVWTESDGFTVQPSAELDGDFIGMSPSGSVLFMSRKTVANDWRPIRWDTSTGQVLDLGVLPGHDDAYASVMSGDGSTIFGVCFGPTSTQAFRWTLQNGMISIGPAGWNPIFTGVSFDGSVVVGGDSGGAFAWEALTGITIVPGLNPNFSSGARGVSSDGGTVIGATSDPSFPSGNFYSDGTTLLPIDAGPGSQVVATRISGDGSTVIGSIRLPGGEYTTFVWTPAGGATLLDATNQPRGRAVSHDGETVLGTFVPSPPSVPTRSFRWRQSDGFVELPHFSSASHETLSVAMTPDESVIVGLGKRSPNQAEGVLWRADGSLGESYCEAMVPNSSGQLGQLTLLGFNTISLGNLELRASGIPAASWGFFLVSDTPASVPNVANSQGTLCLGGNIGRYVGPGQIQQADSQGAMSLVVDPGNTPAPTGSFSPAFGQSLYYQAWYRDANPTTTSNFTSGATVRFY